MFKNDGEFDTEDESETLITVSLHEVEACSAPKLSTSNDLILEMKQME